MTGPGALDVIRVFVGPDGGGGNPLGVFPEAGLLPAADRQAVATELAFSETVFVEDAATGRVRIHTPSQEIPFAGHPMVGTAWLLAWRGRPVTALRPPAGEVAVREADGLTWIRARPEWAPTYDIVRLESAAMVEAATGPALFEPSRYVWAWLDEEAGRIRSRSFPTGIGIVEDEATGAAAIGMGALLGRDLDIRQGTGSQLLVRPLPDGSVEVGGRCVHLETRQGP